MNYLVKNLGRIEFENSWHQMRDFTNNRDEATLDEFWIVEHDPVFTLGLAGKEEHILYRNHAIPIIRSDRGGQVTYHGPGQIVIYTLIDIKRLNLSIRKFVETLENGIISYLATKGIKAYNKCEAPGVYIDEKKIASLGLKVRRGYTYHGISFNFSMDTTPFQYINVCGYSGLKITQLRDLLTPEDLEFEPTANEIVTHIARHLYNLQSI